MTLLTIGKIKIFQSSDPAMTKLVTHGFCTRLGGVSQGSFRSLNLDTKRGDSRDNVVRNREILTRALGIDSEKLFLANQVHGDQVFILNENPEKRYFSHTHLDYDAIITSHVGIPIGVLTADCLPVIMLDPIKKVVAVVHSGWRGTCLNIVGNAVNKFKKEFGCDPKDIIASIGPCIAKCCYEVDIKVIRSIKNSSPNWKDFIEPLKTNRYLLDLVGLNIEQLVLSGLDPAHIRKTDLCTSCNPELFFSHRAFRKKTGRQLNFVQLNE